MKKITLILAVLITAYTFAIATQPVPKVAETPEPVKTVVVDTSATGVDSTELLQYLTHVNAWLTTCGAEGKLLFEQGKKIGVNVKDAFADLPLPNTTEGLTAWTDRINLLFGSLGSIAVMILTWLFSLLKKNPEAAIGTIQNTFNTIKTRYLLFSSALVVSVVSLVYFDKDGVGWNDIVQSIGVFFGVTIGGLGLQGFLSMLGIKRFEAKKV